MNAISCKAPARLLGLVLAVSCALAYGAADAPQTTAATAAPSAVAGPQLPALSVEQLVQRNQAARGGAAAWKAVQSLTVNGTLDAGRARPDNGRNPSATERAVDKPGKSTKPGQAPEQQAAATDLGVPVTLPYTLYMARPNKQRLEVTLKDETLLQVFDGKNGWKLQPYLHRGVLPFSAEELQKAREFQDIDSPLFDAASKGTRIALDGTDTIDGRPAYRLALTLKSGTVRHVWLDAETFLDVQVDGTRRLNGKDVRQLTTQADFRAVGALKLPFLLQTRADGVKDANQIRVDKVLVNPPLDAALFAKPADTATAATPAVAAAAR